MANHLNAFLAILVTYMCGEIPWLPKTVTDMTITLVHFAHVRILTCNYQKYCSAAVLHVFDENGAKRGILAQTHKIEYFEHFRISCTCMASALLFCQFLTKTCFRNRKGKRGGFRASGP